LELVSLMPRYKVLKSVTHNIGSAYICGVKWLMFAIASIAACVLTGRIAPIAAAERQPLVEVRGPTVVAFFEPVTQEELEKDPDTNEALADFQIYAKKVSEPLRAAGIEFHELSAHSFRLRVGKRLTTFRPAKGVGYYLVEPGKKPRIEYGVMTDADLIALAKEYFEISAK
jgi:hypothetical protein